MPRKPVFTGFLQVTHWSTVQIISELPIHLATALRPNRNERMSRQRATKSKGERPLSNPVLPHGSSPFSLLAIGNHENMRRAHDSRHCHELNELPLAHHLGPTKSGPANGKTLNCELNLRAGALTHIRRFNSDVALPPAAYQLTASCKPVESSQIQLGNNFLFASAPMTITLLGTPDSSLELQHTRCHCPR